MVRRTTVRPPGRNSASVAAWIWRDRRIDLFEIAPAGRGQPDSGARAVEERDPEEVLEAPDLVADRGLGDAQAVGGVPKAPLDRGGMEGAQRGEGRQGCLRLGHGLGSVSPA
jgi:hypothetical protein